MVQATYTVTLDTARNGTFSTDISSDWLEMTIRLGLPEPYVHIARPAELKIVLTNPSGTYSPGHGSALSGFVPGTPLKVVMTYNGTTTGRFLGWIDPPEVIPGTYGERETTIKALGYLSRMQYPDALVVYATDVTAGDAIAAIINEAAVYPPGFYGWRLARPGYSELGVTTRLASGVSDYATLDTGMLVIPYLGDSFKGSVYDALREVVTTDGGWLYVNGDGKLVFIDNYYRYEDLSTAADATLAGTDLLLDPAPVYEYGQRLANRIIVHHNPHIVETSLTEVGALENVKVEINAGGSETVIVPFRNADGDRIAAYDVQTPSYASGDWDAENEHERWKAPTVYTDCSADFSVSSTEVFANQISITFARLADSAYVGKSYVQNIRVRGKAVYDFGRSKVVVEDTDSQFDYGIREAKYDFPLVESTQFATNWAKNELADRKSPGDGDLIEVSVSANKSAAMMALVRDIAVGDRWVISEALTGLSSTEYYVVGWTEEIIHPTQHILTAILEPAPSARWLLGSAGFSELGTTTRLGLGM